jgi:predicted hotdog family 3-hydroxylacyl-ACP dehydratase
VLIGKAEIARLIPHAGEMCLLDGVMQWDAAAIACVASSHHAPNNPLRRAGRLGIMCGVEYAAQAMALHAALTGGDRGRPRGGYLAGLRGVCCHVDRLDLVAGPLAIDATLVFGDGERAIYSFFVRHEARRLIEGRASVVLRA